MSPTVARTRREGRCGGKHLMFDLDGALFGVPVLAVRQIVPLGHLLPLPDAPVGVRGRAEWRGQLLPVADLSAWLGGVVPAGEPRRCLVIVAGGRPEAALALLADTAHDIADISPLRVRPAALAPEVERALAPATAHMGERVARLLDPDALVARVMPAPARRRARAAAR